MLVAVKRVSGFPFSRASRQLSAQALTSTNSAFHFGKLIRFLFVCNFSNYLIYKLLWH